MALGALGTLGAIGTGISEALPAIREDREKRLNAEFVAELQRATALGPEALQQLLNDNRFSAVSPEVRQRAMEVGARITERADLKEHRRIEQELGVERDAANRIGEIARLRGEGYNVDVANEVSGLPSGRFGPSSPLPTITSMTPGEEMQERQRLEMETLRATTQQEKLQASEAEIHLQQLEAEWEDYNNREDRILNNLYAAAKNPTFLEQIKDDHIREEVARRMVGFDIPLDPAAKRAPLAFMLRMAELRSALQDLEYLQGKIVEINQKSLVGAQGPVVGVLSHVPYTESRKLRAAIDRVKQRIGKALEGGVLRKEDEEKYKKILPTVSDDKGTSDFKIEGLRGALQRDMNILEATFQQYGGLRSMDSEQVSMVMANMVADSGFSFGHHRGSSFVDTYMQANEGR
jgi:hypothetical protein